jgi:DNA-binding response OmpR family regulator
MMTQHDDLLHSFQECFTATTTIMPASLLAVGWMTGEIPLLAALTDLAFTLDYVPSVRDTLRALRSGLHFDAILLNGESLDAYTATAALRLYSALPIVLLFTNGDQMSPTRAVNAGADEWLLTTVGVRELAARVKARIRRYNISQRQSATVEHYGNLVLNPRTNELLSGERTIRLTPAETCVFRCLAASSGLPVLANDLAGELGFLFDEHAEPNYLLAVIQQLRTKLDGTPTSLLSVNDNAFILDG